MRVIELGCNQDITTFFIYLAESIKPPIQTAEIAVYKTF